MHAIAMVHKMQRLALSSSSVISAPIHEDPKEETATVGGGGVESSAGIINNSNHRDQLDAIDAIDIDPSSQQTAASSAAAAPSSTHDVPIRDSSIADGSSADPMDL